MNHWVEVIDKVEVKIVGKKLIELVYGWDNIKGVFEK